MNAKSRRTSMDPQLLLNAMCVHLSGKIFLTWIQSDSNTSAYSATTTEVK